MEANRQIIHSLGTTRKSSSTSEYSIPTQQNVSYSLVTVRESQLKTSETPTQVMRSANEDESANNHKYYDVI